MTKRYETQAMEKTSQDESYENYQRKSVGYMNTTKNRLDKIGKTLRRGGENC